MPPVLAGGVRQDVDSEVLVVVVAPEEMTHAAPTAQAQAVGLVTSLVPPEGDLATAGAARRNAGGVDPGLEGKGVVVFGQTLAVKSDVVAATIEAEGLGICPRQMKSHSQARHHEGEEGGEDPHWSVISFWGGGSRRFGGKLHAKGATGKACGALKIGGANLP